MNMKFYLTIALVSYNNLISLTANACILQMSSENKKQKHLPVYYNQTVLVYFTCVRTIQIYSNSAIKSVCDIL